MYQPYPTEAKLPEPQRPPAPPSVRSAVKVMYVGAATSLLGIVINIVTVGATKTAIEKRSPHLSVSQINLSLSHPGVWSPRRENGRGCWSWRAGVRCRAVAGAG